MNIFISPNPASDYIEIKIDDKLSESHQIKTYNVYGEYMLSVGANGRSPLQRIDISNFPNGIYFLRINNGIQKFVVLR